MPDAITVGPAEPGDGDILGEIHALSWGVSHGPFCTPKVAAAGIEERRTKWHGILAEVAVGLLPRRFRCSGLAALRSGSACHRSRGLLCVCCTAGKYQQRRLTQPDRPVRRHTVKQQRRFSTTALRLTRNQGLISARVDSLVASRREQP
ncbi:hypothetical protein ACGF0J_10930 [Nonomuraea sp. NPDC047897]|uniref:hypothetical protein n=1 Tax=Nonomuraea sp. NPDC047897 TaxID=3364346 RepID=UPI0037138654